MALLPKRPKRNEEVLLWAEKFTQYVREISPKSSADIAVNTTPVGTTFQQRSNGQSGGGDTFPWKVTTSPGQLGELRIYTAFWQRNALSPQLSSDFELFAAGSPDYQTFTPGLAPDDYSIIIELPEQSPLSPDRALAPEETDEVLVHFVPGDVLEAIDQSHILSSRVIATFTVDSAGAIVNLKQVEGFSWQDTQIIPDGAGRNHHPPKRSTLSLNDGSGFADIPEHEHELQVTRVQDIIPDFWGSPFFEPDLTGAGDMNWWIADSDDGGRGSNINQQSIQLLAGDGEGYPEEWLQIWGIDDPATNSVSTIDRAADLTPDYIMLDVDNGLVRYITLDDFEDLLQIDCDQVDYVPGCIPCDAIDHTTDPCPASIPCNAIDHTTDPCPASIPCDSIDWETEPCIGFVPCSAIDWDISFGSTPCLSHNQVNTTRLSDRRDDYEDLDDQDYRHARIGAAWDSLGGQPAFQSIGYANATGGLGGDRQVIDLLNNVMLDVAEITSVDADARRLLDATGFIAVDYETRLLRDDLGLISAAWNDRALLDSLGFIAADWEVRDLLNLAGAVTVDWEAEELRTAGALSVDWGNRLLVDAVGVQVFDWDGEEFTLDALGVNGKATFTGGNTEQGFRTGQMAHIDDPVGNSLPLLVAKVTEILAGLQTDGIMA